jgi:hypothetical protein
MKEVKSKVLRGSALAVEKWGKYYSPVDTGRLRASIGNNSGFGDPSGIDLSQIMFDRVKVGPTAYYAKYVHRRTPFMYSATRSSVPDIEKLTKRLVKEAIK